MSVLPAPWRPLGGLIAYRLVASALVAMPTTALVGATLRHQPDGDASLFTPGGVMLVEVARQLQPLLGAAVRQGGVLALVLGFGALLPLGALIASLDPAPAAAGSLGRAAARFGTLSLLFGLTGFLQAVALALCTVVGRVAGSSLGGDASHRALGSLTGLALGLSTCWLLVTVQDVARVVVVQRQVGIWSAMDRALSVLAGEPWRALWASFTRTCLAVALLAAGGWWTLHLVTSEGPLLAATGAHVAVVAMVVGLRASWLGWASRAHRRWERARR